MKSLCIIVTDILKHSTHKLESSKSRYVNICVILTNLFTHCNYVSVFTKGQMPQKSNCHNCHSVLDVLAIFNMMSAKVTTVLQNKPIKIAKLV